jgi:hypothetical protein
MQKDDQESPDSFYVLPAELPSALSAGTALQHLTLTIPGPSHFLPIAAAVHNYFFELIKPNRQASSPGAARLKQTPGQKHLDDGVVQCKLQCHNGGSSAGV